MMYVYTGDNVYEIRQRVRAVTEKFIAENGELAVERIDGDETSVPAVADAVQSMPFLASQKLVVISNVSDKDLLEALAEMDVPESTELVVIVPKVDKRATYYKKIAKLPGFHSFDNSDARNLPAWVSSSVKEQGGTVSSSDARYLVERVGANQLLVSNELTKLLSYDPNITRQTIDLLCDPLPQTSVFQLLDAAFSKDLKVMERIYAEQRAQKVEPHAILGMIAWQLHVFMVTKTAGDRPVEVIAKDARINPFVVRKSSTIVKRLSLSQLEQFVREAKSIDTMLKTSPVDADQAIQGLLLKFSI